MSDDNTNSRGNGSGGSTGEEPMTVSEAAEKLGADPEELMNNLPPMPNQPDECPECGFEPTFLEGFDIIHGISVDDDAGTYIYCPNCENHIAGDRFDFKNE